jgi:hypothetical protein
MASMSDVHEPEISAIAEVGEAVRLLRRLEREAQSEGDETLQRKVREIRWKLEDAESAMR